MLQNKWVGEWWWALNKYTVASKTRRLETDEVVWSESYEIVYDKKKNMNQARNEKAKSITMHM